MNLEDSRVVIRIPLLRIYSAINSNKHIIEGAAVARGGFISDRQWIRYEFVEQQPNRYLATIAWVSD